jgi:hypothetical protein
VIDIICTELTKALRAEIYKAKGMDVPSEEEISKGGSLQNAEPLFFHKLEKGYPQILWGSLTHEAPPATIFGHSARKIKERLVAITMEAIDARYFPPECNSSNCPSCQIHSWQLKKCQTKVKTRLTAR